MSYLTLLVRALCLVFAREASWRCPLSNGSLKSLCLFWTYLAQNQRYEGLVAERDINLVLERSENEGITFLTTVLPGLGKALDCFHSTQMWTPPPAFKTADDGIPIFLGKPIKLALEGNSVAVDCVRQLSFVFYKLEVDHEEQVIGQFLDRFIRTDHDLGVGDSNLLYHEDLITDMKRLIARVLCNEDPRDIRPCHGSGATACRTQNSDKWHVLRYFPKLDAIYCYSEYFFYSLTHLSDEAEKLFLSIPGHPRARVVLVPKDSRGPRVISCEPAELMYIQQGLMRKLYKTLETHPLTAGYLNFSDQSVNRSLAHRSSITGEYATIDLKDASDMVSLSLVRKVFPPNWVECFEACRSEETILPDGRVVKLNKFAPMGSSCCFPVEALVFWACVSATYRRHAGYGKPVWVYGDDIIVPSQLCDLAIDALQSIGLLVNREKTYSKGPFRESCGGDYHNGYDVTPIRLRKFLSKVGTGLATGADLCNEVIAKFGEIEALPLIRFIEEEVGYVFPRSDLAYPCVIRIKPSASNDVFFQRRFNKNLQRYEHRILSMVSEVLTKRPPNWGELLRKELTRENASRLPGNYEHPLNVVNATLQPGEYAVGHTARSSWQWVWLG